jgi:hypothetical protein
MTCNAQWLAILCCCLVPLAAGADNSSTADADTIIVVIAPYDSAAPGLLYGLVTFVLLMIAFGALFFCLVTETPRIIDSSSAQARQVSNSLGSRIDDAVDDDVDDDDDDDDSVA